MTKIAITARARDIDDVTIVFAPADRPSYDFITIYHERTFGELRTRINWSALGSVDVAMAETFIDAMREATNIALMLERVSAQGDDARRAYIALLCATYPRA